MSFDTYRYFKELEELVNIDSGSYDVAGLDRAADYLEGLYREEGLFVTRRALGDRRIPHIVATTHDPAGLTGKEKPWDIMFIGHFDTVFPEGTVAERPFSIEDGKVKGPGAADMKAGDLMSLYLIKELRKEFPDKCFAIVNNSDEELGSPDSGDLLVEISGNAKYAFDMEPGRITGNFVKERKGAVEYWVETHGKASHAGNAPEKGAHAIYEMARWLLCCEKLNNSDPGLTVSPGLITGGTASNTIPDYCQIKVDVRIVDPAQKKIVEDAFDELVANPTVKGVTSSYIKYSDMPPMRFTAGTAKMVGILTEEAQKMDYHFDFESAGGASDASFVSGGGTPVLDACGPHGEGLHSAAEYFFYDTVVPRYELIAGCIRRLLAE